MNKNLQSLRDNCTDKNFKELFVGLFALREFLSHCLVSKDFRPPDELYKAMSLTSEGEQWVSRIQSEFEDISQSEIRLALLVKFFCEDILVDIMTTSYDQIREFLNSYIIGGIIRFPWVYDRVLYDRFYEMFPDVDETLSDEETLKLLENTSQGVFQISDMIVGPFGVLTSSRQRFLPPVRTVPLWHCPDPSCTAIHPVLLSTSSTKVSQAIHLISTASDEDELPEASSAFFRDILDRPDYYDHMLTEGFPWLLVNGFSHTEFKCILARLIDQYSKEIRTRFPNNKRFRSLLAGSGQDIANGLTKAQCFQLILLMSDYDIINCLELLTKEGLINIPATEMRTTRLMYGSRGWFGISWECSRFGLRSVSTKEDISFARLKLLIEHIYLDTELKQLEWKLRHVPGQSIYERLDTLIHKEDPKQIVRSMILDSAEHLQDAFSKLQYGMFVIPPSTEEEESLVDKILWKLGFDIRLYPPHEQLFWNRLGKLVDAATSYSNYDESVEDLIRSAGVNFFVSLEEILDHSLSFVTWALLSDHYRVTKFRCDISEARQFMASRLNGRQLGPNEPLEFDPGGKNTLYPLIQGFAVLAELCGEIIKNDSSKYRRPKTGLPRYYGRTEIEVFPFLHTVFVLDLTRSDYEQIISLLHNVTGTLEGSQICDIRNRLEHKRADFPNQKEIIAACEAIKGVVNKMEESGISPLVYLYSGETIDKYGRGFISYRNYRERGITISVPSQLRACRLPPPPAPLIISPSMHIGNTREPMRFECQETSEYTKMWQDYPKRRRAYPGFEEVE